MIRAEIAAIEIVLGIVIVSDPHIGYTALAVIVGICLDPQRPLLLAAGICDAPRQIRIGKRVGGAVALGSADIQGFRASTGSGRVPGGDHVRRRVCDHGPDQCAGQHVARIVNAGMHARVGNKRRQAMQWDARQRHRRAHP